MSTKGHGTFVVCVLAILSVALSGGCQDLKYHRVYMSAVGGAAIGAIVGHQSDECGAGAGIGAAVFAVGELLHQIDDLPKEKKIEETARTVSGGDSLHDLSRTE